MTRKDLYDVLQPVYPTYSVGQHQGECKSTYLVVKFKEQEASSSNSKGGWQNLEVMIYVPVTSAAGIEPAIDKVNYALRNILEATGNITPDFMDSEKKAIMRSVEFRAPKQLFN